MHKTLLFAYALCFGSLSTCSESRHEQTYSGVDIATYTESLPTGRQTTVTPPADCQAIWNNRGALYLRQTKLYRARRDLLVQAKPLMDQAQALTPDIDSLYERIQYLDSQAVSGQR